MGNFLQLVDSYGRAMPRGTPPCPVVHPHYGYLGESEAGKGFVPAKGHWASCRAIAKDHRRAVIRGLQRLENIAHEGIRKLFFGRLRNRPLLLPWVMQAIGNYDGIVAARGGGNLQDVWMMMTATQTPVTTSWYDLMSFANWQPATAPSITGFTAGTGGAVMTAATNGSWISNPAGSNKKYIASCGVTITATSGFCLGMLYDCLWAGQYVITASATTITASSPIAVTRWASTTAGNADFAGGNQMMMSLASTLTITTAGTLTTTYTDQAGVGSKSTIWVPGPTGALVNRVVGNTTHNTSTVINSTPFMPLTNSSSTGVTAVSAVATGVNSIAAGTINHKIVRPLLLMPFIAANSYIEQDTTLNVGNMVELRNASQVCGCLGWNTFSAGTTAASMSAFLRMIEG